MNAELSYEESLFDKHSTDFFDSYTVGFQPNFYVVREERKVSRQCVPPGADINSLKGDILFSWKLLMNFMSLISISKHHQHKYYGIHSLLSTSRPLFSLPFSFPYISSVF
jgi:hypothetical protein